MKRVYLDEHTLSFKQKNRFWGKILRTPGCWEWMGGTTEDGYGCFYANDTRYLTHVVAHVLKIGPVGEFLVCHECDNPKCCNPQHLFLGTSQDNVRDSVDKGRHSSLNLKGSDKGNSKLTEEDIPKIKFARSLGHTYKEIGRQFKVDPALIHRICLGKVWRHV